MTRIQNIAIAASFLLLYVVVVDKWEIVSVLTSRCATITSQALLVAKKLVSKK